LFVLIAAFLSNNGGLYRLFEVGVGRPFLEIEAKKGTRSTRILRCRVRFKRPW